VAYFYQITICFQPKRNETIAMTNIFYPQLLQVGARLGQSWCSTRLNSSYLFWQWGNSTQIKQLSFSKQHRPYSVRFDITFWVSMGKDYSTAGLDFLHYSHLLPELACKAAAAACLSLE